LALPALDASAAVPGTVAIEGNLVTAAGGPITDGTYSVRFSLYKAKSGGAATWSETAGKLGVKNGAFAHALGSIKKLGGLDAGMHGWLGVKIGNEPELARSPVHAVPFAHRAGRADALACTGCVSVKQLKFDGDIDLGKFGIKAAKGTFGTLTGGQVNAAKVTSKDVVATTVAAKTFVGDGSKLTGIKTPAGSCKNKGEVVKGIDANGGLICVKAMDPNNLPADGLDEISNGLLSTEFTDRTAATKAVPIKDNWPVGVSSSIVVPDNGTAKGIRVSIHVTNSDFKKMKIELTDPAKGKHVLFSDGKVAGGVLKATYPPTKLVSGNIAAWIGQNPKGTWTLQVTDGNFKDNKVDGEIKAWWIEVDTLSNKKVQSKGALLATGGFGFPLHAKAPFKCDVAHAGRAYVNTATNQLFVCINGTWRAVALQSCGNGLVEIGEACDDGIKNSDKTANACRTTCVKAKCGDGVKDSGEQCDDGNTNDADSCKNNCKLKCTGVIYKNQCIQWTSGSGNSDQVPAGCNPSQPSMNWNKNDYVAICNAINSRTGKSVNCSNIDMDGDGGRCSNKKMILAYEQGHSSPDVWVHSSTFNFKPTSGSQNCNPDGGNPPIIKAYICN